MWLWNNVPDLFFILTLTARGGLNAEAPAELRNEAWVRRNLLEGHGPLAARYPAIPPGRKARFIIKEGDSPTFLHLVPPGLSDPGQPEWGGWGGRRARVKPEGNVFVDARDHHPTSHDPIKEEYWTMGRWAEAISHDFEARFDWCVKDRSAANHAPMALVNGDATLRVLRQTVTAGETVVLDAAGSHDPDGDALSYKWWQYVEPGSLRDSVALKHADTPRASFVAPSVSESRTLHVVLEVKDRGEPQLTGYRRIVFTIKPGAR